MKAFISNKRKRNQVCITSPKQLIINKKCVFNLVKDGKNIITGRVNLYSLESAMLLFIWQMPYTLYCLVDFFYLFNERMDFIGWKFNWGNITNLIDGWIVSWVVVLCWLNFDKIAAQCFFYLITRKSFQINDAKFDYKPLYGFDKTESHLGTKSKQRYSLFVLHCTINHQYNIYFIIITFSNCIKREKQHK